MEPNNPTQIPVPAKKTPWYFRSGSLVVAVLLVGPLALPLVWMSPKISRVWKLIWTVLIILLTLLLMSTTVALYEALLSRVNQINSIQA